MVSKRTRDPRQLPVQLNVSIPFSFREFLSAKAVGEGLSLNKLVTDALTDKFGEEHERREALIAKKDTKDAGATK